VLILCGVVSFFLTFFCLFSPSFAPLVDEWIPVRDPRTVLGSRGVPTSFCFVRLHLRLTHRLLFPPFFFFSFPPCDPRKPRLPPWFPVSFFPAIMILIPPFLPPFFLFNAVRCLSLRSRRLARPDTKPLPPFIVFPTGQVPPP